MRTRRSWRNQDRLFKQLFKPAPMPMPVPAPRQHTPECSRTRLVLNRTLRDKAFRAAHAAWVVEARKCGCLPATPDSAGP